MTKDKANNFDSVDFSNNTEIGFRGVVFVNDLSKRSDFIFTDWGLPIFRPKNVECAKAVAGDLSDLTLSEKNENLCIDDLAKYVRENLKNLNQDTFFLVVSFDQKQPENFNLLFSGKANMDLLTPVEKNFTTSKQKFRVVTSYTNVLFKKLEASIPGISCFELRFADSHEGSTESSYTRERIFEEALIFATLAVSRKI
ncbi:hypothetical protein [Bdellovibrio sp. HCB337]|uniref:hypothetical protein n=1 Tax=Bdellovibrio sp. HCB337 TaxID=3394358 RepID=UPI0039A5B531